MELYIDQHKTDAAADSSATLGQVLEQVKKTLATTGRIVVGLECDGRDMTGEGFGQNLDQPSASFSRIDMQSAETSKLVSEALEMIGPMLDETATTSAEIVDQLAAGKIQDALPKLAQCCQVWGQVNLAISNAVAMLKLDVDELRIGQRTLTEVLSLPADLLRQLKEVVEAKDFVLLSDILSYEFSDAIDSWRAVAKELMATAGDK